MQSRGCPKRLTGRLAWAQTLRVALLALMSVLLVVVLLAVPGALAHTGGDADVAVTIDTLPDAMDGMSAVVVNRLAPQIALSNSTQRVVEILGSEGRPFLRIGPGGVEANLAVSEWYTTNDPGGATAVPDDLAGPDDLTGPDRWGRVSTDPSWGWFDHRLHPGPLRAPQEIVAIGQPADYDAWTIDLLIDDVPTTLTGAFRYQPLRGRFITTITQQPLQDGLEMAVLPGLVPGFFVDNTTEGVVTVAGVDGEPFLRLDPTIGTEANVRSPSWFSSARAQEGDSPDGIVDADAEPDWRVVATVPRFGWIDPRLDFPGREPDASIVGAARTTEVAEWTIPMTVDGQVVTLAGVIDWEPNPDLVPQDQPLVSATAARTLAVVAVGLLALVGWWFTRRTQSRKRPDRHAADPARS